MTARLTVPLKRVVLDACDGPFGSSLKSDHYRDDGARVIRLGNVGVGSWVDGDAAYVDLDYWRLLNRHHALPGDLIVAGLGDENHPVGRACVLPEVGPAMVKADCYRLRLDPELADARFVALFLSSAAGSREASKLADGATRSRLTLSKALSIPIPDIDLERQRATVDYLDAEAARIDMLVGALERLREICQQRAASGAAFAFNGPPVRVKYLVSKIGSGKTPLGGSESYVDDGVTLIRSTNVRAGFLELSDVAHIDDVADAAMASTRLKPDDVLLNITGASIGRSAVVPCDLGLANVTSTYVFSGQCRTYPACCYRRLS